MNDMWLLVVEACVALFLLVFIVWWTMFAGRKPDQHSRKTSPPKDDDSKP
jgi:hypothetical protein